MNAKIRKLQSNAKIRELLHVLSPIDPEVARAKARTHPRSICRGYKLVLHILPTTIKKLKGIKRSLPVSAVWAGKASRECNEFALRHLPPNCITEVKNRTSEKRKQNICIDLSYTIFI